MLVILVCLVLAVDSSYVGPGLYTDYQGEYAAAYDNYIPKPYAFEYGVSDPHTGDHKSQWETKDAAGVVRGSYSLLESDGSTRVVDYVADDHGFRAVVKKIGIHGLPESIQNHGGEVLEAPFISPIVVPEPGPIQVPEPVQVPEPIPAAGPIHVNYETPLPVEAGPLYHSYDGGLEHYQNLYNTQPLPFRVPEAQDAYVELPKHQFGGYIHQPFQSPDQVYLGQPNVQPPLFAPSQTQPYVPQTPPQGLIAPKIDDLETQYGPPVEGGYQVPQYVPQPQRPAIAPSASYPAPGQYPVAAQGAPGPAHSAPPVDTYSLELAYGEPHNLGAPRLVFGGQEAVRPISNSYVPQVDNSIQPQASYEYVQDYGQNGGSDLRLNQGEYLPPGAVPLPYRGQEIHHK